jgi:hypothetical protein
VAVQQGLITMPGVTVDTGSTAASSASGAETSGMDEAPAGDPLPVEEPVGKPAGRPAWHVALPVLALIAVVVLVAIAATRLLDDPQPGSDGDLNATDRLSSDWYAAVPLPRPLSGLASAAVGLTVYAIGGSDGDLVADTVYTYATDGSRWESAAPKPTAVADAGAAVLFGEIYVPGGRGSDGRPTSAVEVYSPTNDAWRAVADLPEPLSGALVLADGSFIYVFGGWNGINVVENSYVYDPGADAWRSLAPLPVARAFAAGGAVAGQLYVVGGNDGAADLGLCHVFDLQNGEWGDCPPLLAPRGAGAAFALYNRLYLLGGGVERNDLTFGEVYDPTTRTWQVINVPEEAQSASWTHLGVAVVERRVYVTGGQENGASRAGNLIFMPLPFRTFIPSAPGQ